MLAPGTRIDDRYEIIDMLGAGGMGQVYRARRLRLGDEVAIKVMPSAHTAPDSRERFLRESRACAQLRHPNIVGLLDFDFDAANQPFMVMELLSGPSLREEIELESPMSPARVADILAPVAAALQLAHDRGITHRDLKPANIVVHRYDSGERVYKVIDFGLAAMKAAASDETRLTDPGFFLGTLSYAAPEQVRGDAVTAAADVYALGVIAYEMLTGARPFDASNRVTLINQVLTETPVSPAVQRAGLPPTVDLAVMRALAKDPVERWPSAADFVNALRDAGADQAPERSQTDGGLLSRYELGALAGRGRLGSLIYRGTHRALGVPVAIRILKRDEQPHWDAVRARFLLEARTQQVPHPGLLQVRDFGEDDHSVFLVTDFVEGPSLREALAETGAFPWQRASALLLQALDAVAALHRNGGFVCGVNPDMIRLRAIDTDAGGDSPSSSAEGQTEQIVVSSAGIRSVQDVLATMREQELRGQEASEHELPYVAPEVLMGGAPDERADVFTIGVLAYEMVTGRQPFRAASVPELLGQMLQAKPDPPLLKAAGVPVNLNDAILRAISGSPAYRFESAEALAAALLS